MLRDFLKHWLNKQNKPARRAGYPPEILVLDERIVPADFYWAGNAGTNWQAAAGFQSNWRDAAGAVVGVPGPADTAIFGNLVAANNQNVVVASNTNSTMNLPAVAPNTVPHIGKLDIRASYTQTITFNSRLNVDVLVMAGGNINLQGETLVISQRPNGNPPLGATIFAVSNWTSGTITGTGAAVLRIEGNAARPAVLNLGAANQTLNLQVDLLGADANTTVNWAAGNVSVADNRTVTNAGTFNGTSTGTMGANLGAGETWTFQNDRMATVRNGAFRRVNLRGTAPAMNRIGPLDGTGPSTFEIAGSFVQDEAGTLTSVESGTFLVTGTFAHTEGDVTVKGDTLLSITGDYTQDTNATLNYYLTTPSTGSGLVAVGGTVSLAGMLNVTALAGFSGSEFTLISNTGGNAIDGPYFQGLDEGAVLSVGGYNFQITYFGGTSTRDVVLSSISHPIVLTSSANPSYDGHSVTFTATVTPSNAVGNVNFYDNGNYLGYGTLAGGVATYTTSALSLGTHLIKATYGGNSVNLTHAVLTTPTIITADNTDFTVGWAGSFTVVTSGSPTSTFTQSGSLPDGVTFTDNGDGTATLSGTPDAGMAGTYTITIATEDNGVDNDADQTFVLTVHEPTVAWQDDFTDSDDTELDSHTPVAGDSYTASAGTLSVESNKLKATAMSSGEMGSYCAEGYFDSGVTESRVTLDFSLDYNTMAMPVDVYVILRYDPSSHNGFVAKVTTSGLYLYQLSSGSLSQVAYTSMSLSTNTTYSLAVENTSSGISADVGSYHVSYSSTTGNTETKIGFGMRSWSADDSDTWIDNLVITTR